MNVFDILREKLREAGRTMMPVIPTDEAIRIVDQVEKEYNNGRIPYSERLRAKGVCIELVAERGDYIMNKAALIIDMPETCSKCEFAYEFNGINKCSLLTVLNFGKAIIPKSVLTTGRKEECPLVKLPKPIPPERAGNTHEASYIEGWNDCVEKITEGIV